MSGGKKKPDADWYRKVSTNRRSTAEAAERREKFLRVLAETNDVQMACKAVPVEYRTYLKWRQRFPEFRAKADSTRTNMSRADTAGVANWTGGFADFRKQFLGHDSPWFHLRIIDALENAKPGHITLILMPPEHGKTTLLEDWFNMKLALDPTYRVTFGSEGLDHGKKVLGQVRSRMEEDSPNHEYVARFGPFAPQTGGVRKSRQPWGDTKFNVWRKQDDNVQRDYNMRAIGIGGRIQGTRTDLLSMDDIQSVLTLSQSETYLERFRQDWLSRSGSKAPVVIVGTRVGPDDFYELLMAAGLVDELILFPAHDEDGNWLWPERYTPEEYAIMRRNAGEEAWARNYMQDPLASSSGPFAVSEVDAVKNHLRSLTDPYTDDQVSTVIGIDPGFGINAMIAAGMSPSRLTVLSARADRDLRNTSNIIQLLEDECYTHHTEGRPVTHVIIENKAFQKALIEDEDLLDLQKRFGFDITGHDTGVNKRDTSIGVPGMARSFRRQEIDIPWGGTHTQEVMQELVKQLVAWRPTKRGTELTQDLVMALWFCWIIWRQEKDNLLTSGSGFTTDGIPWGSRPSGLVVPTGASPLRRVSA